MSKAYKEYKEWLHRTQTSGSSSSVSIDHVEELRQSNSFKLDDYIQRLIADGPEFLVALHSFEAGEIDSIELAIKLRPYRDLMTHALVKIDTGW